jgi:small subunit ribosomal protein S10
MKKKQTIRIILCSYDMSLLEHAVKEIVRVSKRAGSRVCGPTPLPRKRRCFTTLRSPNNDKKSREQFEIITYRRLLDIEIVLLQNTDVMEKTMQGLMNLDLSSAVDVCIK